MSAVFQALAAPRRREILRLVWDREHSAGDIHRALPEVSFGAVSQHLRVLAEAKLVTVRREGRNRHYRLHPRPLRDVVSWIDEFAAFFSQRLDALGEHLDRKHGKRR